MLRPKTTSIDETARWSAVTAFVGVLLFNGLAGSSALLGGMNTAEISQTYPTLFTPAGVTFAIWAVIYALLIGFCLYFYGVGRPKKSVYSPVTINTVLRWFTFSSVLNVLWILVWQYQIFWLSIIIIAGMLYTLIKINQSLRDHETSGWEYVLVKLPFSIYFAWLTVATIANICVWLVSVEWDGFGIRPGIWTVVVLLVGALVGLLATIRNNDAAYLSVFVWAYTGILLQHLAPDGHNGAYPTIIVTLVILLAVFISAVVQRISPSVREKLSR